MWSLRHLTDKVHKVRMKRGGLTRLPFSWHFIIALKSFASLILLSDSVSIAVSFWQALTRGHLRLPTATRPVVEPPANREMTR